MAVAQEGVKHGDDLGFNWNFLLRYVAVNADLNPLSYLLSSMVESCLKMSSQGTSLRWSLSPSQSALLYE